MNDRLGVWSDETHGEKEDQHSADTAEDLRSSFAADDKFVTLSWQFEVWVGLKD